LNTNYLELIEEYQGKSNNQEAQQFLKNTLLQKDIWYTVEDLGLKLQEHSRQHTINFSGFLQDWFKLTAKLFTLAKAKPGAKFNTIYSHVCRLKIFSLFLKKEGICEPEQINNHTFEAFTSYLISKKLKTISIRGYYQALSLFFELCRLEGWLSVNTYWFKNKHKVESVNEIKYIPEEVLNQLNQNIHYLPESLQRMVILIRTLGLRGGELCNMPFDCIRKRGENWHIRFNTEKYNVIDELPIPIELVAVIKEQQQYIRHHFNDYDKLFCANKGRTKERRHQTDAMLFVPEPKVMLIDSFNRWLNRLAKKCKICSKDGNIWHFQSHQFRRTLATVMTNAGVRSLIIEKYLRHRSPDLQRYYAHLMENVLKDEFEHLMKEKKYVDHTGRIVASHKPKNLINELIYHKIYQVTTQYGECHRPILKSPCPTVNACWRCQHWRTSSEDLPYLKEDLKRTEEELKIAQRLGMNRQREGLEIDCNGLVKRIQGLEKVDDRD
jgi:integrase